MAPSQDPAGPVLGPAKDKRGIWRRVGAPMGAALMVAIASLFIEFVTEATLLSEVNRHTAARLFAPYNAYFYGLGWPTASVSERLLVVNVGQATLDQYKTSWPMSYRQHARILERIRRAEPKALFVDFQFQASRDDPSLDALKDVLCAFKADGIPVFLAAGSDSNNGRLRPEIEGLRDSQGRSCFEKVAVGYQAEGPDKLVWTYPLVSEVGGQTLRSAALAVAEVVRESEIHVDGQHRVMGLSWASSDRHRGPGWRVTAPDSHTAVEASEIAHGVGAEAARARPSQHHCRAPLVTDIIPLQAFFGRLLGNPPDTRPACPLHETVEAAWLTAPKSGDQVEAQSRQLKDRAVFYGGSFDAADIINSPLHGELPGVYLHAQAADNLARHGNAWRHPGINGRFGDWAEWPMLAMSFFTVALLFMVGRSAVVCTWRRMATAIQGSRPERMLDMLRCHVRSCIGRLRNIDFIANGLDSLGRFATRLRALCRRLVLPGYLSHSAGKLTAFLGRFYLSLLLVVPASLLLEWLFQVSAIGYSNVLAICLLGEIFTEAAEAQRRLGLQAESTDSSVFPAHVQPPPHS